MSFNVWPIHRILSKFNIQRPIVLEKEIINGLTTFCLLHESYASLSGSFASNLSKTQILKDNPFPTTFEGIGDIVWWAQIAQKCRVLIYPTQVCSFLLHERRHKSLSKDQNYNFIQEIIKTLKLNHDEKTLYEMLIKKVLKNKDLHRKYKFFRLLMPIRYINKFKLKKISRKVEKIIHKLEKELTYYLITKKLITINKT